MACGFSQVQGIDYEETFSPVVRLNSIRILLSMAIKYVWPLHQLDVSNAFLCGDLTECVYMEQPPSYSIEGENDKVCLLRHALYGLKQSPRAWFEKFSALVFDLKLVACNVEPTVFCKITFAGCVILAIYVDDMIITGAIMLEFLISKRFFNIILTFMTWVNLSTFLVSSSHLAPELLFSINASMFWISFKKSV